MEDLFCQVSYDVIGYLRGLLAFNYKADELCHRGSHVFLIVQEVNDLLDVLR